MTNITIIGLTGPSGAGKGLFSELLIPYNIPAIDTDRVYHDLLIPPSSCLDALVERFGQKILAADGGLDRKALAAWVFAEDHGQELLDLNAISHKFVLNATRDICAELSKKGCPAVLVDAPLLFESGFDAECDQTLAVLADPDVRLCRIMARDGLTLAAAKARMNAQKSDGFYVERADHVIHNNGEPCDLTEEIKALALSWGGAAHE